MSSGFAPPGYVFPDNHTVGRVGGVPFRVTTLDQAVDWLLTEAAPNRLATNVRLANAYCVALADANVAYRNLLVSDGVNLPDGLPIAWFMNLRRGERKIARRVRGPSFFIEALRNSAGQGVRHFLLGSTDETLRKLRFAIEDKFPGAIVCGTYSPPFTAVSPKFVMGCVEQIRPTDADVIWVGLGTPKQDFVGTELARILSRPAVSVGAAFDFTAGTAKEAPNWVQRSGFEWLYRLAAEPRRLWRRYLFGNVRFLVVTLRNFRSDRKPHPST